MGIPSFETIAFISLVATLLWVVLLILPWCPWCTEPFLDVFERSSTDSLKDVTVLIPARNESRLIQRTLSALQSQSVSLNVILVDDQSTDDTTRRAQEIDEMNLKVIAGCRKPEGWSGKLWALEQGRQSINTKYTLLMDADIKLSPGIIAAALMKMEHQNINFLSLMAAPHMGGFWEKLLMPAFVYFFKLIYPFRLSNSQHPWVAAAAGGFILLETKIMSELGGFDAIRDALIDDCTLARRVKNMNYTTWIGLSHSLQSMRAYNTLTDIWNMVARTAYTQLHYSITLLVICTVIMIIAFQVPLVGLVWGNKLVLTLSIVTVVIMMITYRSVLSFYDRSPGWALTMPLISLLFLAMTWTSAIRYWRGERAQWRGRAYSRNA